jgi:hypothetical protein
MRTITVLFVLALLLMIPVLLPAQDKIIKRNNDTIHCKVIEIGMDQVKYSLPEYPDDLSFSIDKNNVRNIVFSNGKEMIFHQEMTDPENYSENRKNAVKVDFISPLTGNTTLGYEHSIKPGRSIEAALGIIGLGVINNDSDPAGAFMKFGYKFIKTPDFYMRGMRYAHILKGGYVRPEIQLGYYNKKEEIYNYNYSNGYYEHTHTVEKVNVFTGALLLNLGKQWIYDNFFLVDIHGGIGYGFDTNKYTDGGYNYGFVLVDDDVPISFTAGLKIGFLIK